MKIYCDLTREKRETMIPCGDIEVFPDRTAAERRYPIRTLQQLMEEEA